MQNKLRNRKIFARWWRGKAVGWISFIDPKPFTSSADYLAGLRGHWGPTTTPSWGPYKKLRLKEHFDYILLVSFRQRTRRRESGGVVFFVAVIFSRISKCT